MDCEFMNLSPMCNASFHSRCTIGMLLTILCVMCDKYVGSGSSILICFLLKTIYRILEKIRCIILCVCLFSTYIKSMAHGSLLLLLGFSVFLWQKRLTWTVDVIKQISLNELDSSHVVIIAFCYPFQYLYASKWRNRFAYFCFFLFSNEN